ncbi:MAG: hypothetical protein GY862_29510 [Gammaproteobacteria bacterium]|nr:hypothetical protein [Gammaproteobacteria bacterium]
MRIVLIESGGFVGVSLQYEVDVSALDAADLSVLERAMVTATAGSQPPPTSAGGVCIRMERDDRSVNELTLSHATPAPEIAELIQRLRTCAKIILFHK